MFSASALNCFDGDVRFVLFWPPTIYIDNEYSVGEGSQSKFQVNRKDLYYLDFLERVSHKLAGVSNEVPTIEIFVSAWKQIPS